MILTIGTRNHDLPPFEERTITITPQMWFCLHYHHDLPPFEERTITITPQMWFCLLYHHDLRPLRRGRLPLHHRCGSVYTITTISRPLRRGRLPLHHRCGSVYTITTISRPWGEDDYHYTTDVVLFTLSPRSPALVERTITITPPMWFCLHYLQIDCWLI